MPEEEELEGTYQKWWLEEKDAAAALRIELAAEKARYKAMKQALKIVVNGDK